MNIENTKSFDLVKKLYKNQKGEPFELSPSQIEVFNCIFKRKAPDGKRNIHCTTFTRFGKSDTAALALLTRVSTYAEKWGLVAPSDAKAKIIMGYVIEHIFDNSYTKEKFKIDKGENLDRIRRERSKNKLTFKISDGRIGELFIVSAQETRRQNPLDALMGFGAPNLVVDESSLIDDVKYAGILRMLGDVDDPFIFEIGNPFRRNHFLKSSLDPSYYHIFIDYIKGLKEGRITQEQVDRMINKPFFDVLYKCLFPAADAVDLKGWYPLLTEEQLDSCKRHVITKGAERLGVDVGRGGDPNVFVKRSKNLAKIIHYDREPDTTITGDHVIEAIKEHDLSPQNVFIDITGGSGAGTFDTCQRKGYNVRGVVSGSLADDSSVYKNIKAETYWLLREWALAGGCFEDDDRFDELLVIKYKEEEERGEKRVKIMPTPMLIGQGIPSPNVAAATALTFTHADTHDQDIDYADIQPKYARSY